jgi:hypothetical protein
VVAPCHTVIIQQKVVQNFGKNKSENGKMCESRKNVHEK